MVMVILMFMYRKIRLIPGLLPWFAFIFWALAASTSITSSSTAIGYAQRLGNLMSVGVFMLYYVNARENITPTKIIKGLMIIWLTVIFFGTLAIFFPTFRLHTPVGALLPESLTKNPLVYDLVFPPLAEVQQPWGAPLPFNRPAAPFPYANSWGVAFVLLTPVAIHTSITTAKIWARIAILAVVALSFWPALATSNRGMLLGLAITVGYVLVRVAARGQILKVAALAVAAGGALIALIATGALESILGRQEYSDSTSGRLSIYEATLAATLKSPFLGYGAPRLDSTIGISLGTQGYIWMLMFSYGFIGLGLFIFFLLNGTLRTWGAPGTGGIWLHGVLIATLAIIPFYSLDIMQMTTVALVMVVLLRAKYYPEPLRPPPRTALP